MPTDSSGKYRMNAQIARSPLGGKKAAAASIDQADPNADPNAAQGQEESVTITRKADGTYSYSDSKGQTQDVPDYQSALAMQAQCFGESGEPDADDQGAQGSPDDQGGSANAGAMGY